jgi:hypothetical protein
MYRVFVLLTILCLCGCSMDQQFVQGVDTAWEVIGPRYVQYIQDDGSLDDVSKGIRIRTAEALTRLIEEAKDESD